MSKYTLTPVNCDYGAPMGRWECHKYDDERPRSILCFNVPLDSGGYDSGGAYWGLGMRLYCIVQPPSDGIYRPCAYYREFFRATSRGEAIAMSEIPGEMFARRACQS